MLERSLWPVGAVAGIGASVVVSGVALWVHGGGWTPLLTAAAVVVLMVLAVRRDILADDEPNRRLHAATAATVMGAGFGLMASGIAAAMFLDDAFGMPVAGALFAGTGYWALRRQRIRQVVPA